MKEKISFDDQITSNKLKSFVLIAIIFVVFLIIGYLVSVFLGPGYFFIVMSISIIFSLVYLWASYYFSSQIALASVRAKPASHIEHKQLYHAVENMSIASGLPTPKVYVMQSEEINAFASGRDPKNAVICFTTGSLKKLNKQELEGVVAHEMSHIANYDIRFMTLTAVVIGLISIAAEILLRSMWFSNRQDNKNALLLIIASVVVAILAPILAQLISLAISRKREFLADATGAKLTRYPQGLASALKKIRDEHVSPDEKRRYSKEMAPLFISDPFKRKITNLLSTHPDVNERIRRLEAM